jgi:TonB-linked SusC/RagA family outer membrane protein
VKPYQTVRSEADYYELYWEAMRNQYLRNGVSKFDAGIAASQGLIKELGGYNAYDVADADLINPLTGRINPAAKLLYHDDWDDEPYNTGQRQEYNASISGGSDKTRYYVSLNYLDEKSYIKGSDFSRISGRVNLEHKVNNWLTVGVNANYSNTQSNYTATAGTTNSMFAFTQGIAPIYPVYQRNGDGSYILNEKGEPILDYGVANGKNRPYSMGSNPFLDILYNVHDNESDVINLRGFADVKLPIKGLTFHINGAMDNIASYETDFQTPIVGDAAAVNGRSTKYAGRMRNITASQRLNYFREFDKWNISLMAGHESLRRQSQGLQAQMTNFFIPDNNEFSNGVTPGMDPASSKSRYSLESYFGRAEVSILDRYSVSASYRRDGSSKFHPDKRWGDFWSVGAAWRLSEEEFFQTSVLRDYVDNFKVKASYGTQGNDAIGGDYALYLDQFSVSNVDGKPGITLSYRGNPDLTWEKSTNFNVGFESSFLKNRLMLEFDYFIKVTSDMLFSRRLAPSLGAPNAIADNGMEMQNEGVELTLTGVLMKKKNFKWNASLNLTHYKNTINELEPGKEPSGYQNGSYWRKVGGGLYDYYMVKFAGVDPQTGDALYYQDVEKTGVVSDAEGNPVLDANGNKQYYNYTETITTKDANSATKYELGKTSIPDVYGGLSTSFEAYGFDLSISTAFQWGGYCYDGTYGGLMGSNAGSNYHIDMFKRWQKPGDITNVPKLENGNMNMTGGVTNDRFLTSSDYFSLKNVQLGYTFPKNLLKKFGNIESLRVYVVGDNLFLGARRYGLDPRQSLSGATSSDSYSAMRTFSFGVNLAF